MKETNLEKSNNAENPVDSESIAIKRIIDTSASNDEKTAESALRPKKLTDFVGQDKIKKQLEILIKAAKKRAVSPDHILLAGPPGLGKTTLSMIVANELGMNLRVTSGPAIQHAGDLAAILSSLTENEVLFIDEIHRLARPAQELLYVAMEDFRVDIVVGKGVGANAIPLSLPRFTVIGATTRTGLLPAPLRDRFGFLGHISFYSTNELTQVVERSGSLLNMKMDSQIARAIAMRSRGTPRVANRLVRRIQDWTDVNQNHKIDLYAVEETCKIYDIDEKGLDKLDKNVLISLYEKFNSGPVGLSTLSATLGEEAETIESVIEPFLVREGYIARTPKGRILTELGKEYAQRIITEK